MRMRSRLAWAFALSTLGTLLLVLLAVNAGMYWSMGHLPGLGLGPLGPGPLGPQAMHGGSGGFSAPGAAAAHHLGFGHSVVGDLALWSVLAGVAATLLAALAGRWLAGRTAGPLAELAQATGQIGLNDLVSRVREPNSGDEVADLARSFNRMLARLEQEDRARRQMLADVAHELRHPIAVIQTQLELLQDGVRPLTPESLAGAQDEVLRLRRLVSDLQDLSLAEAGALSLHREVLAPGTVLEPLLAGLMPLAQSKEVRLTWTVAGDAPAVAADPQRLRQVLMNLLSNAFRYAPAGGTVDVQAHRHENGWLRITVADTGAGIDPEDLPHVFERFYRADRSRSRQGGGSGLGLAIASSLVRLHGGRIAMDSAPGRGTTVTVDLPPAAAAS